MRTAVTGPMKTVRAILTIAAIIAVSSIVGGVYGLRIGTNGNLIRMAPLNDHVNRAHQVTRWIDRRFVENVDWSRAMYEGAIPSMLATLDPHSTFLSTEEFLKMREHERGSYAGVGMQIVNFGSKTVVEFPFPETPAFEAGILPGDTLEMVDNEPVSGLDLNEVAGQVKGPPGTSVHLSLSRSGLDRWIEVDLVRHVIPRPTISTKLLFEDGTGYLRINSFGERTGDELDAALRSLEDLGMRGLLLDLRDNKGGLLSAGVKVASRFLERGQSVVSHRGRNSPERRYGSEIDEPDLDYPIVVLVNCNSASASEIVAGALQDHDRALIAGTNTFGKGLVQSVFALPEETGMVLTMARYYSPSGRLIQRPYDNLTASEYFTEPCSEQYSPEQSTVRLTDGGRKVYELGGIAPDVQIADPQSTPFQRHVEQQRMVERFVARVRSEGRTMLRGEAPAPEMLGDLLQFMADRGVRSGRRLATEDRQYLMRALAIHLHISYFDYDEGLRVQASYDPVVLQARSLLGQAVHLMNGRPGAVS